MTIANAASLGTEQLNVEEKVASLFQPDVLVPEQYFETFRRKARLEPEKRLMLAVLEDAIFSFQKYVLARDPRHKKLFREAEDWILDQDTDWIFSFQNICEVMGFNPEYVRQGLIRWKEGQLVKPGIDPVCRLTAKRKAKQRGERTPKGSRTEITESRSLLKVPSVMCMAG